MLCLVYGMWHCHLLRNFLPHTGAVDDALRRALAPPLEAGDTNQYGEWARETPDVKTVRHTSCLRSEILHYRIINKVRNNSEKDVVRE